ncbi:MAG TPA: D-2-hydroxyacid dehydrogenase [Rhizomicrobium sp.]|nr:D-2-hydroxyacid dehydrogenase [Rhizomicrobium sp.]
MTRILLFETSYNRLKDSIDAVSGITPIVMTADRKFLLGGKEIEQADVKAEAGWLNNDLFQNQAIGGYLAALIESPNLKWIQSGAAGFEHPIFKSFVQKGATLTTNHSQSVGMAEYVLATVLDHFQKGPARRKSQAESKWERHEFREIMKSRWLIVGFGAIGQDVAKRARAFGAHITGVRRSGGTHEFADAIITPDQIAGALPTTDVVVLSLPLSKATENMVDAKFLAALKSDAVLVNVGRGGLVDEDALLAALDKGTPEFAILDVFKAEPLPSESRFYQHPRVFLTPHASPIGTGLSARGDETFLENLRRYTKGEPMMNLADPKEVLGE